MFKSNKVSDPKHQQIAGNKGKKEASPFEFLSASPEGRKLLLDNNWAFFKDKINADQLADESRRRPTGGMRVDQNTTM